MILRPLAVIAATVALSACATAPSYHGVSITTPTPGQVVSSPFLVEGVTPEGWRYFEAIFSAQLIDGSGRVLAEAPAQAQTDWMTPGPIPFVAEFHYQSATAQAATVLLTEDDTGESPRPPRQIRISVMLTPSR